MKLMMKFYPCFTWQFLWTLKFTCSSSYEKVFLVLFQTSVYIFHSSSSGPWGLLRSDRRSCHPSWSEANAAAATHVCHPSLFLSFSMVLLHVSLCWPRLLLPSGAHVKAVLEMLSGLFLNMCPNHRHLLTHIRTDTGIPPVASYSSLLLKWLGQNLLSTLLRHVQWNTSSLLRSVPVTLHISAPYNSTVMTFKFRMRNLVFWLNLTDLQMFWNLVNAVLASASRLLMSASAPWHSLSSDDIVP